MIVSINQLYNILARWGSVPIQCPHCFVRMPLRVYYRQHVKYRHGVDPVTTCPFCFEFRWPRHEKARPEHVLHRLECAKTFLVRQRYDDIRSDAPCTSCIEFESTDSPGVLDMLLENKYFFPKPNAVQCTAASGLGWLVPTLLNSFDEYDWYHAYVKNVDAFLDRMEPHCFNGFLTVLPFGCRCGDGRHVLVACIKGFELETKRVDKIESQLALACWINHTSRPGKKCGDDQHYDFTRTVYPHALVGMCATFPGGIHDLLSARCHEMDVQEIHDRVVYNVGEGWTIPLHYTDVVDVRRCVLPVPRDWEPTPNEISRVYVPGLDLWFNPNSQRMLSMSRNKWNKYQRRNGNSLLDAATTFGQTYILSARQQCRMDRLYNLKMDCNVDMLRVLGQYESERDRYRSKYLALLCENAALEKRCRPQAEEEKNKDQTDGSTG